MQVRISYIYEVQEEPPVEEGVFNPKTHKKQKTIPAHGKQETLAPGSANTDSFRLLLEKMRH